jgi:hypothetical protein
MGLSLTGAKIRAPGTLLCQGLTRTTWKQIKPRKGAYFLSEGLLTDNGDGYVISLNGLTE